MGSPLKPPRDNWWDVPVNRRESIWLGLGVIWSIILFGWMSAYTRIGDQNPIGETYRVSSSEFQDRVNEYMDKASETEEGIVPAGEDVFVAGSQFSWIGLPVVLETNKKYRFHLGSLDVQHGFSIRPESVLSQHTNLQVLPGYEWVVEMEFQDPDTYHVICNEFCGVGHRTMHGEIIVKEEVDA